MLDNRESTVSHYPDFLITFCIHAFENFVQSMDGVS